MLLGKSRQSVSRLHKEGDIRLYYDNFSTYNIKEMGAFFNKRTSDGIKAA